MAQTITIRCQFSYRMAGRNYFPVSIWIWRTLTGRTARRVYVAVILLLVLATTVIRVHSYLLTRKFQAVISGLSKLHIDETTEEEVVRTVPYLGRAQCQSRT